MAQKKSPITPSVLSWTLMQDGRALEDVAHAMKVAPVILQSWSVGEDLPTVGEVTRLATVLRRPRAFFFLPEPPPKGGLPSGFRHPPGAGDRAVGAGALVEARRAKRLQQAVVWATNADQPPEIPQATLSDDAEATARIARSWLGVPDGERWPDPYAALRRWREATESVGVLVFALGLGKDEVRGFASWDERAPLVVMNTTEVPPSARCFTIGHELGHILLRQATACLEPKGKVVIDENAERWCEAFAAALLMPRMEVLGLMHDRNVDEKAAGLDEVRAVMDTFRVSARASALRLAELGYARPNLYAEVRAVFRPKPRSPSESPRNPRRSKLRLRQYGKHTVSLILGALPPIEALSVLRITVEDARRIADEVPGVAAI